MSNREGNECLVPAAQSSPAPQGNHTSRICTATSIDVCTVFARCFQVTCLPKGTSQGGHLCLSSPLLTASSTFSCQIEESVGLAYQPEHLANAVHASIDTAVHVREVWLPQEAGLGSRGEFSLPCTGSQAEMGR